MQVLTFCQVWRGYMQRKRTKIIREEELIFLGMVSQGDCLVLILDTKA